MQPLTIFIIWYGNNCRIRQDTYFSNQESNLGPNQGVSISVLRWCRNSQKGSEPKNFKIWKSSLPCAGHWENQVCNCHFHLHCFISEIFWIFYGTFSRHFLLARNSPGRPGRKRFLPGLPENFKFPGKIFSLQASQAGELFCLASLESF